MARPPQYDRDPHGDEPTRDVTAVKATKALKPGDRARLLVWLALYYDDTGLMFSPRISRRRQRMMLDGIEYWLVRVPRQTTQKTERRTR